MTRLTGKAEIAALRTAGHAINVPRWSEDASGMWAYSEDLQRWRESRSHCDSGGEHG